MRSTLILMTFYCLFTGSPAQAESVKFRIRLYKDVNGKPGALIGNNKVTVGDPFFVEITAQVLDPLFKGLHGCALNIYWEPRFLEEIDDPFDPAKLVTPNLPLFRRGKLDQSQGTINNLSGSAFHASGVGKVIGGGGYPERFALLHFRALQTVTHTSIRMNQGRSSIVAQPTATFSSGQIKFVPADMAIKEPNWWTSF
jgi:hypothetical protein